MPNAVPMEEIAAVSPVPASAAGIDNDRPLILFAGRFHPQKNLETLLPTLKIVMTRTRAQALFCGEGPQRASIESWIGAEKLQRSGTRDRLCGRVVGSNEAGGGSCLPITL